MCYVAEVYFIVGPNSMIAQELIDKWEETFHYWLLRTIRTLFRESKEKEARRL